MQQIMGAFDSSYDLFRRKICGKSYSWSYPSQDPSALRHYLISMEKTLVCGIGWMSVLGCISGSRVHNAKSVCVRFLVNSSYYLVCRMYGKNS